MPSDAAMPVDVNGDGDCRKMLQQCIHTGGVPTYRCKRGRMTGKSVCRHHQNLRDKRNQVLKTERLRKKILRLANQAHHDLELRLGMGETPPAYTHQLLQLSRDSPSHVMGDIEWSTGRCSDVSATSSGTVFPAASDLSHVSVTEEGCTNGGPHAGERPVVWESWAVQEDDGISVLDDEAQQEVGLRAGSTLRETVVALAMDLLASNLMSHGSVERVVASIKVHLYHNHYGLLLNDLEAVPVKLSLRSAWVDPVKGAPVVVLRNGHSFGWDFGLERWNLRYLEY